MSKTIGHRASLFTTLVAVLALLVGGAAPAFAEDNAGGTTSDGTTSDTRAATSTVTGAEGAEGTPETSMTTTTTPPEAAPVPGDVTSCIPADDAPEGCEQDHVDRSRAAAALGATSVEVDDPEPAVPSWTLALGADPQSGELVSADQEVTYTLTVENTSEAELAGESVVDDLAGVLGNAVLDEDSFQVDLDAAGPAPATAPAAGAVTFDDTAGAERLTWQVPTRQPHQEVALSYAVTVNPELAYGATLVNVSAPGPSAGNPVNGSGHCVDVVPAVDECSTNHGTAQIMEASAAEPRNHGHTSRHANLAASPHPQVRAAARAPQAGPSPAAGVLPNTGGPTAWYLTAGVLLLLSGLGLALGGRRGLASRG